MSPVGKEEQLFEVLRELPTEISLGKVELMVKTLPPLPLWKNWLHYLNLNTILMSAITTTIIITSLLLFSPKEQQQDQTFAPAKPMMSEETSSLSPEAKIMPRTRARSIHPVTSLNIRPIFTKEERKITYSDFSLPLTTFISDTRAINSPPPLQNDKTKPRFGPIRPNLMIPIQYNCDPPLDLTKENQKRLKQQIRRSLLLDHLIFSKKESIIIEVPPGEIIVNGTTLGEDLYEKYSLILYQDVPPCPGRHLVIGKEFVGIGHFTSTGQFKGVSTGPLPAKILRKSLPASKLLDLTISDVSSTELFTGTDLTTTLLFDENLKSTSSLEHNKVQDNDGNVFGLSWGEMQQLKRKLLARFIKDKLIEAKQKKAILSYRKESIMVNGKALSTTLADSYRELLSTFRIAASANREIHIAPQFIIIGNFTSKGGMTLGQASGKDMIVNQRKPSGLYADDTFRLIHAVEDWH